MCAEGQDVGTWQSSCELLVLMRKSFCNCEVQGCTGRSSIPRRFLEGNKMLLLVIRYANW